MKQITRTQVSNWLNNNVGAKHLTFDFRGNSLGAQCVGLTNAYSRFLGLPVIPAWRAKDSFANADGRYYSKLKNSLSFVPKAGDIAVFDDHISVVRDGNHTSFVSLDQNWVNSNGSGSPAAFVKHNYLRPKIIGFLRPVNLIDAPAKKTAVPKAPQAPAKKKVESTYIIKRNDTFWGLEKAWRMPHGTLQRLNPKLDPKKLQIGQKIRRS